MKTTTQTLRTLKGKRTLVAITAYDYVTSALADRAGVDLILVGDSLGNTVLGYGSTVPVTVEAMLHHSAAVARAKPSALVVADIPFGIARRSPEAVLEICARFIQESGVDAVKLEGGVAIAETVGVLTASGIPVLGHIGLLPQQVLQLGGYRRFGKNETERRSLLGDARALVEAGVFGVVGEMIHEPVAAEIQEAIPVPLIGIGSGPGCGGQILVLTDVLGLGLEKPPSFVKTYANLRESVVDAVKAYAEDVRAGTFPAGKS